MMARQNGGVAPEWLRRLEVASELGPHMVAHAHGTTSPRCSVSEESLWDWLSPGGFSLAGMVEVQLPRPSIAHVIGKGGGEDPMIGGALWGLHWHI